MTKTIKLTTPWSHNYLRNTPKNSGIFGDFRFEIDNDTKECDYWVVWGNLRHIESVKCSPENIFYITDEAHDQREFNPDFLDQFSTIITQRDDIANRHIIKSHDLGIWHFPLDYDSVSNLKDVKKTRIISSIASDLTILKGHKARYAFINRLIGHYKDKIDFYGRGFNYIEDKTQALLPYKYSVAVENSFLPNYFTEKIFECFLCHTLPIYYGCPNIESYFDERSFVRIDINDLMSSIKTIDDVIRYDVYNERLPFILESKRIFLDKYLVFPALSNILSNHRSGSIKKKWITLKPENSFGVSMLRRSINLITKYL